MKFIMKVITFTMKLITARTLHYQVAQLHSYYEATAINPFLIMNFIVQSVYVESSEKWGAEGDRHIKLGATYSRLLAAPVPSIAVFQAVGISIENLRGRTYALVDGQDHGL